MAEEKKHYIYVSNTLVEVSEEVYLAYYQEDRRRRTADEKEQRNGTVSYDNLDTVELSGAERFADRTAVSVEDAAIDRIMADKLHRCIDRLPREDRALIRALFFDGLSERKYAEKLGIHHMTVHNRKVAILRTLKKLMKMQKKFGANTP